MAYNYTNMKVRSYVSVTWAARSPGSWVADGLGGRRCQEVPYIDIFLLNDNLKREAPFFIYVREIFGGTLGVIMRDD